MKKWLAFLFLFLMLAGSFYPCCIVDDCTADHAWTEQQKERPSKEGTCSPFFACASCVGFVQLSRPIAVPQPLPQLPVHYESVERFTPLILYSSFWQPPRFC